MRAHAAYALALLDRLGIARAHVLGFSMGGGGALHLWERAPERVASVTLLAATGVQELELLGDYRLNHAVHGLQLAAVRFAEEGVPHFGALDGVMLGRPYARNFFDTDQRPLRGILGRLEPPALIVHGEDDPLVPVAAALEHHRLVPQSELVLLPTDHFFLFRDGGAAAAPAIREFLARAEAGWAPTRAAASAERRAAAAEPFDPRALPPLSGLAAAVTMLLLAAGTLISEDLTSITAGLLAAQGRLSFWAGSAACAAGIFGGDLLLFVAGRVVGRPALSVPPLSWWLDERAVEAASAWFRRRGVAAVFATRFFPGARLPTYFAAGVLRTGFWRFAAYFALAVAVWTPLLVGLAAVLGGGVLRLLGQARLGLAALLTAAVVLALLVRGGLLPALTRRGRRRLAGRWQRWRHWEFWPPWLFYPPVVVWILWLGLRHRGTTVFTAANPGMPAGGFIGESKREILERLEAAGAPLPRWEPLPAALPAAERLAAVERFRERAGLGWPLVLKPDAGQRGDGVAVVRSAGEAARYLEACRVDALVQEHVPGAELGVFYVRRPDEERGRVISITEKAMPEVAGDGRRTVEELILDDRRAVALADLYLTAQGEDRDRVPAAGERVRLVEIGTHCRGAIFRDGRRFATPELEAAVDRIGRASPGFYFGRFDLRGESHEEIAAGRFRVVELNGVTSEATHIYDRGISLLAAWRTLAGQWRLAFEIGAENRRRGVRPTPARALLAAALRYRRQARRQGPAAGAPPASTTGRDFDETRSAAGLRAP
jgi:membrane protein DedA with SNARE-associated domain